MRVYVVEAGNRFGGVEVVGVALDLDGVADILLSWRPFGWPKDRPVAWEVDPDGFTLKEDARDLVAEITEWALSPVCSGGSVAKKVDQETSRFI